jgi:hypothetical protein
MNNAPRKGDKITVTIAARPTEVLCEYFCCAEGRAELLARRMKLRWAAYGRGYVVYSLPTLRSLVLPDGPPPGDHPAMRAAMT